MVAIGEGTGPHLSLFQSTFPLDMLKHVTTRSIFHRNAQILVRQEHLPELDDMWVQEPAADKSKVMNLQNRDKRSG